MGRARHTVTSGRDARAASSVTCRCRLVRARERRQRVPSRTGPLTARTAGSTRQAASRGARTRQLRRELLRHGRRVVHRRGAARPAVIDGSCRPASTTSTPLTEGHGSNRCTRTTVGSRDVAAVHYLPTEPTAAITAAHRTNDGTLDPGQGEWAPRSRTYALLSACLALRARGGACRGMLTSVTVQHPRASGIASEKCATLASPGWIGSGGSRASAHAARRWRRAARSAQATARRPSPTAAWARPPPPRTGPPARTTTAARVPTPGLGPPSETTASHPTCSTPHTSRSPADRSPFSRPYPPPNRAHSTTSCFLSSDRRSKSHAILAHQARGIPPRGSAASACAGGGGRKHRSSPVSLASEQTDFLASAWPTAPKSSAPACPAMRRRQGRPCCARPWRAAARAAGSAGRASDRPR